MNKIGIIVAEDEELFAIKEKLTCVNEIKYFNINFVIGNFQNKECVLVKSGVGKVNSARTTQLLIDKFTVDYVINVGSAGALVDNLNTGDIVIADKCVQVDFDVTAFGREKGELPSLGKFFYSDKNLLERCKQILEGNCVVGIIATSDSFVNKKEDKEKMGKAFNAKCCEMEGASIAQVCTLCNIPFIVIRSISDELSDNSKIEFSQYLKEASKKCADFLEKL